MPIWLSNFCVPKDHFEAANFAAQLEECNKARKLEEDRIYHAARQQALNLLEKKIIPLLCSTDQIGMQALSVLSHPG